MMMLQIMIAPKIVKVFGVATPNLMFVAYVKEIIQHVQIVQECQMVHIGQVIVVV